jgi:flavin reductase (DIM6/NTAB) family NADH-FMN oxidoreductase RutF
MPNPAFRQVSLDEAHDPRELRNALGRFATGVTVITTATAAGKREGLTANSFAALSLDPPLVLWSLGLKAKSLASFVASGHFAIHVLRATQTDLSHRFATPAEDKFAGLPQQAGLGGVPLLPNALATFECATHSTVEAGDHLLFIGRVRRLSYCDGEPLVFNAGHYATPRFLRVASVKDDLEAIWGGLG